LAKISAYSAEFSGAIKASAEIEEVIWLNHKDKLKCSLVAQIMLDELQLQGLIE
jgi:hypothetical protein